MKCPYCSRSFLTSKDYHEHHKLLHCLKPFICLCGRNYSLWRSFEKHFKKCTSEVPLVHSVGVGVGVQDSHGVSPLDPVYPSTSSFDSIETTSLSETFLPNIVNNKPSDPIPAYHSNVDSFVSKLYGKPKLPRGYVQMIIDDVSDFFKDGLLANLKKALILELKLNDAQHSTLDKVFSSFQSPFFHLRSEYHRFNYFTSSGDYIPPIPYKIGEVDVNDGSNLVKRDVFGQYVPLEIVLKKYLETPNALNEIISYINSLETNSDVTENFVQSKLWQKKREHFSSDDIVLPLHVFYDDCQCNNPLGAHVDKLGCTYVQIPCLPPECQSNTDNIFLALIFKSSLRTFGDELAFAPLISSLKLLENGIIVNTQEGPRKVYFLTGLLLGDNQGLNSVGGFVECFTACHYCRFCKTSKYEAYSQCVEDVTLLRTKENYIEDLAQENATLTGLKSNCVFNDVASFHITSNYSVDIFHDLSEGTCHYTMMHVLRHCIPKYFTLDEFNHRLEMFQFGLCDSNRLPTLPVDFAKREKLKMSGSETLLFVRLFGIIIGDKVPPTDEFWLLYIKLRELLDICESKSMSTSQGSSIRVLVEEFNSMYVKVTKDTLKPKMHNLVHYGTVCEESGSVALTSTKRFERKHRHVLVPARATESRRDICRTVAIQHQLNMYYRLKCNSSILPQIEFGPVCDVHLYEFSNTDFLKSLPENIYLSNTIPCLASNWVKYKGTKYKPGMVLLLRIDSSGGPVFGQLEEILVSGNVPVFVYSYLLCLGFDAHVHAYVVQSCDRWACTSPHELHDPLPLSLYVNSSGENYVPLRYAL